jgi:hypothetical protein
VWMELRFLKQWAALREKLLEEEKASQTDALLQAEIERHERLINVSEIVLDTINEVNKIERKYR